MKKLGLFLVFLAFITCGCAKYDRPSILFNNTPITAENFSENMFVFKTNERIYYLVLIPKEIESRIIDIQIIKKDNDYQRLGYKLYWSHTAHLKDNQLYYYDDYVVIPQKGAYVMRVFSHDNPTKILCIEEFHVEN